MTPCTYGKGLAPWELCLAEHQNCFGWPDSAALAFLHALTAASSSTLEPQDQFAVSCLKAAQVYLHILYRRRGFKIISCLKFRSTAHKVGSQLNYTLTEGKPSLTPRARQVLVRSLSLEMRDWRRSTPQQGCHISRGMVRIVLLTIHALLAMQLVEWRRQANKCPKGVVLYHRSNLQSRRCFSRTSGEATPLSKANTVEQTRIFKTGSHNCYYYRWGVKGSR